MAETSAQPAITPAEAADLSKLVEASARAVEVHDLAVCLAALEQA